MVRDLAPLWSKMESCSFLHTGRGCDRMRLLRPKVTTSRKDPVIAITWESAFCYFFLRRRFVVNSFCVGAMGIKTVSRTRQQTVQWRGATSHALKGGWEAEVC